MKVVNSISTPRVNSMPFKSAKGSNDQEALNAVNKWENNTPKGEDRSQAANIIRDVIKTNTTELNLSCLNVSSLPDVLPRNITELKVYSCINLSALPNTLPSGLTKLDISYCDNLFSLPKDIPEGLIELNIIDCNKFSNAKISLPNSLQSISLYLKSQSRLPLPFDKLPDNLKDIF